MKDTTNATTASQCCDTISPTDRPVGLGVRDLQQGEHQEGQRDRHGGVGERHRALDRPGPRLVLDPARDLAHLVHHYGPPLVGARPWPGGR
jgi:hypothetical protein